MGTETWEYSPPQRNHDFHIVKLNNPQMRTETLTS